MSVLMKQILLFIVIIVVVLNSGAQSIDELRQKKSKAAEEIEYTNKLLDKAKKDERTSLNQLRLINNKINKRSAIINSINSEIEVFEGLIADNNLMVNILEEDLSKIKVEYAEMIRFAFRNKTSYDKILFLLSSNDFNQAYKRRQYLKQYTRYRQKQADVLKAIQSILEIKVDDIARQIELKEKIIRENKNEAKLLGTEKSQQGNYLKKMQKQQRDLRRKLRDQQQVERQLQSAIQKIIEEQARKLNESGAALGFTPEQKLISDNFEQNKRRIPWPVEKGIITEQFGVHKHPVLKNIIIENSGIDITTETGAKARSVFKGEVTRVFGITGGNMAVIIRHGKYLSVYSNLIEVIVKKGDVVDVKQPIGTIYSDPNENFKTVLKFQIWQESKKQNPEYWIAN